MLLQEDEHDMEVDTATSATQTPAKHPLPELEIYCYLLVLIFLIDQKKYKEVRLYWAIKEFPLHWIGYLLIWYFCLSG